ncbi:MAG: acyl-CoA thioesterase [Chitinophagaceae bacterium]
MERVKIAMPESYLFTTQIPVRITDVNYGGHVGNNAFLGILHEARMQFLQQYNCSEMNFFGCGLIMLDAAISFKRELFYGQVLTVNVTISSFTRLGFDMFYQITIPGDKGPIVAAEAKTGMMCFDYELKKKTNVPDAAIEAFKLVS